MCVPFGLNQVFDFDTKYRLVNRLSFVSRITEFFKEFLKCKELVAIEISDRVLLITVVVVEGKPHISLIRELSPGLLLLPNLTQIHLITLLPLLIYQVVAPRVI